MANIEDIRKAMCAAQVTGSGNYIKSGKHLLELKLAKYQRTMIEAKAKESIVFEFTVHASTNPEMKIGETSSYVDNPDNTGFLGRVKACVLALMGLDSNAKLSDGDHAAATECYLSILDDGIRVQNGFPENFFKGRFVECEGVDSVSQTNHKPIVKKNWRPASAPATT